MSTMDYVLRITDNSTGTVTLTSDPFDVREYHPRTGKYNDPTVSETINIRIQDGSSTANLEEMSTLQRLLKQANDYQQDRTWDRVYLEWQNASGGTVWRSEIKAAHAELDANALKYPYWTGNTQFGDIFIERVNWWEGPEAQIPLTNPNGTATLSALTIYNSNLGDGGTIYNYVDIPGTAIAGDMPGNTRLELTNTDTGGTTTNAYIHTIWIGHSWHSPFNNHHWEAENYDYINVGTAGGGGTLTSAGYSGGTVIRIDFSGYTVDSQLEFARYDFDSTFISQAQGAYYKLMLRSPGDILGNLRLKFVLAAIDTGANYYDSGIITPTPNSTSFIHGTEDLLTFQMPPWLQGESNLGTITLRMYGYAVSTFDDTMDMDFWQLLPVDGYRKYSHMHLEYNNRIVDDGINGIFYKDNGSGSNKIVPGKQYGSPIMLQPNKDQRLIFLWNPRLAAFYYHLLSMTVKLYYRPRRRTL
jgi:hypothetical protein